MMDPGHDRFAIVVVEPLKAVGTLLRARAAIEGLGELVGSEIGRDGLDFARRTL